LYKLNSIKAAGLKELIDQLIFSELLPKLPHQLKHVEILRVYVLLPLTPTFYSGSNSLLPIFFADRLQSLNSQMVSVVTRWMYNGPVDQLVRLISVYKKTILSILEDYNQTQSQVTIIFYLFKAVQVHLKKFSDYFS